MKLTDAQQDALSELINIGFGRAANALSVLVGRRVLLEAPEVKLASLDEMGNALTILANRDMTTVHQVFTGKISGDMVLLMDEDSSSILIDLLQGGVGTAKPLSAEDKEILVEAGNILLNAFCGSFGNLLNVHLTFSVPNLRLESMEEMLTSLTIEKGEAIEFALIVKIHFRLSDRLVNGYLVIVMGIQSLEAMLDSLVSEGYIR